MDMDWRAKALCKKKHQDFWYPPLESDVPEQYFAVAREVCKGCPVWQECLDDSRDEKWGMWSGLTPKDRQTAKTQNEVLLRPHGSWLRYRQGCRCHECTEAHKKETTGVNVNLFEIPNMGESLGDISALRYKLLG